METMTGNILDVWGEATDAQMFEGRLWYHHAHTLACTVGNWNVRKGAGVIAALSPQKSWEINQRLALATLRGTVSGHTGDSIRKTERIMAGEDPADVLPEGRKTWHFFHNILTPDDPRFVTIDRHAFRVASAEWGNGNPRITITAYREMVRAYQHAAKILRVPPSTVQATTWLVAKER